jgi:pimeloyl-ACP methyl ester carboxylesterase
VLTIRSVEISGYSITVNRTGAAEPTVVLESGCGNDHSTWSDLQRALSGQASVVSYDRPGAGQSDRPREARTIAAAARLLRGVLDAVGAHRPAVLVGHSLGGVIAAQYARFFPADVHHLVLLDPTPPGSSPGCCGKWPRIHPSLPNAGCAKKPGCSDRRMETPSALRA